MKPIQLIIDLLLIILIIYFTYNKYYLNFYFLQYILTFWILTSYFIGFYNIYRHTRLLRLVNLLFKQFVIFILGYYAYFGVFRKGNIVQDDLLVLSSILLVISVVKLLWFFILKKYRALGNNLRSAVVLGFDESAKNIIRLFKSKSNLGYKYLGFFSDKVFKNTERRGNFYDVMDYASNNQVDEIYLSLKGHSREQVNIIKKFTTEKDIVLKLIPNTIELYSKNQTIEYYDDALMVLNVQKLPFDFAENFYKKRIFDICFSLVISILILSWLMPILWIIVKLESKGPLVFKQKREGLNGEDFTCYKFRSMTINDQSNDNIHTTKGDVRITKVGSFLRKTSIDELPQFFNVFLGQMSVVGPRPHIESLSLEYQKDVDNYLKRHIVKPGITGLAQVSGYRGEVKKIADIKNRVRLDIFYIENWSFFLDIKIIIQTVLNIFKGEEKAY